MQRSIAIQSAAPSPTFAKPTRKSSASSPTSASPQSTTIPPPTSSPSTSRPIAVPSSKSVSRARSSAPAKSSPSSPSTAEGTLDEDLLNAGSKRIRDYFQRDGYFDAKVTFVTDRSRRTSPTSPTRRPRSARSHRSPLPSKAITISATGPSASASASSPPHSSFPTALTSSPCKQPT